MVSVVGRADMTVKRAPALVVKKKVMKEGREVVKVVGGRPDGIQKDLNTSAQVNIPHAHSIHA